MRAATAPHVVPATDPRLSSALGAVDLVTSALLRRILHGRPFQRLEATWRGVRWLVANADQGDIEIDLLQVSPGGVAGTRRIVRGARSTPRGWCGFATMDDGAGGRRVRCYAGRPGSTELCGVPGRIGGIGVRGRCRELAASRRHRAHCSRTIGVGFEPTRAAHCLLVTSDARWAALRNGKSGRCLGLTWPRVLARLPYGRRLDPIQAFPFEELEGSDHDHEECLWTNGAYAVAVLAARRYLESDDAVATIGNLPSFAYGEAGEAQLKPCAECHLPERAVDAVLARGIMPIVSYRQRNAVRLVRLQSLDGTAIADSRA